MNIAIVGLGYVGLPLCLNFARSGCQVLGVDIDPSKVSALNEGRSYIKHIEARDIVEQTSAGRFSATSDCARIKDVEAVIICVPTPLNRTASRTFHYILETGQGHRPPSAQGHPGRARIDHLPRHHR